MLTNIAHNHLICRRKQRRNCSTSITTLAASSSSNLFNLFPTKCSSSEVDQMETEWLYADRSQTTASKNEVILLTSAAALSEHNLDIKEMDIAGGDPELRSKSKADDEQAQPRDINESSVLGMENQSTKCKHQNHNTSGINKTMMRADWIMRTLFMLIFVLNAWNWLDGLESKLQIETLKEELGKQVELMDRLEWKINNTKQRLDEVEFACEKKFQEMLSHALHHFPSTKHLKTGDFIESVQQYFTLGPVLKLLFSNNQNSDPIRPAKPKPDSFLTPE